MVEIKSLCCGAVICEGETGRAAVQTAVRQCLSLRYADLSGLDLREVDLQHMNLSRASFINARLDDTDFRGSDICGAHFVAGSTDNHLIPVSAEEIQRLGARI